MLQEHAAIICEEINDTKRHVAAVLKLLEAGATPSFIAHYRKEATGSMTEARIRDVARRHQALTDLEERKAMVIDAIRAAGALTTEMELRVLNAADLIAVDDIYQSYRPKRRTRAGDAREMGLEPLATFLRAQDYTKPLHEAAKYVGGDLLSAEAALQGASDILAERVADSEKARQIVRAKFNRSGRVTARLTKEYAEAPEAQPYAKYNGFAEPVRTVSSTDYLAIRHGENLGYLKTAIAIDDAEMIDRLERMFVKTTATPEGADIMRRAVADGYRRLMRPAIETEIASALKEKSDTAVISALCDSLQQKLLAAPLPGKTIVAIAAGYDEGSAIAVLDPNGALLAYDVVYPLRPHNDFFGAQEALSFMIDRYMVDTVALSGNAAGHDFERFMQQLQLPHKVRVRLVADNGVAEYAVTEAAAAEYPDLEPQVRAAISLGRRLQDPMAELVKAEPRLVVEHIYRDDVSQPRLRQALDDVMAECVNNVGVNLNTASRQLLERVSGIGPSLADNIVRYREEHGPFSNRKQLMEVSRMGVKAFEQSAPFLRIPRATNILDATAIHPEQYALVEQMAFDKGATIQQLTHDRLLLHSIDLDPYTTRKVSTPTLTDIILELENPGADPRRSAEEALKDDSARAIDRLHIGQILTGKVNNITPFGVFVDLGMPENGLIHISQLTDGYINSAHDVVKPGQRINVRVIDVDPNRGRIALTIKGVEQ